MFEATRQGGVFLTMVYAGLLCGVFYDILRAARRLFGAGQILSAALDILFWIGAAGICAFALFRAIREPVRLYAMLGAACGMMLYLMGVSELLYGMIRAIGKAAAKLGARKKVDGMRK